MGPAVDCFQPDVLSSPNKQTVNKMRLSLTLKMPENRKLSLYP